MFESLLFSFTMCFARDSSLHPNEVGPEAIMNHILYIYICVFWQNTTSEKLEYQGDQKKRTKKTLKLAEHWLKLTV